MLHCFLFHPVLFTICMYPSIRLRFCLLLCRSSSAAPLTPSLLSHCSGSSATLQHMYIASTCTRNGAALMAAHPNSGRS